MNHNLLSKCLAAFSALAATATLSAATLFSNGRAGASIVIDSNASEPVRRAASELSLWLGKASGCEFAIGDKPVEGLFPIYLGDSEFARRNGFDREKLKSDGYLLKSTPDYLLIAGRDYPGGALAGLIHPLRDLDAWSPELKLNAFGEMGTLNGVERFLEEYAGIRWYMTGELGAVVPKLDKLEIPNVEKTNAPDFEYRYAWFCNFPESPEDVLWYRRVGFGGKAPVNINHSYGMMKKYKDTHPEYFALIDGKRDFNNLSVILGDGNYCLSNEGLQKAWVDYICDFFERNPLQEMFPLCPNDGMFRICDCPECQKQLSPELGESGKFSNYVWTFTDKVAREVAKRCPGKTIGTFAYSHYREVPTVPEKLADNVAVMICYTRSNLINPEFKEKTRNTVRKWSQTAGKVYFWTYPIYDYWLPWRGFPRFYPGILSEDLKFAKSLGTSGEFLESEFVSPSDPDVKYQHIAFPALSHLTAYLTVKLLWNADMDVRAELEEYYGKFYGDAAEVMKRFWDLAEEITLTRKGDHPVKVYSQEDIKKFFDLLDEASTKVSSDSLERKRIDLLRKEMEPYVKRLLNLVEGKRDMEVKALPGISLSEDLLGTEWAQATRHKLAGKDGFPCDFNTMLLAAADKEGIAFTLICYEPEMEKLTLKAKERDGAVWDDDSVEFFFDHSDGSNGRHYILSAADVAWDGSWEGDEIFDDATWNSEFQHKVYRGADRWTAQVKIPWKDLGTTLENAGDIRINVYRNRVVGGAARFASFSPNTNLQHKAMEFFGHIKISQ